MKDRRETARNVHLYPEFCRMPIEVPPLPPGEGRGEGCRAGWRRGGRIVINAPSPQPSPGGRGDRAIAGIVAHISWRHWRQPWQLATSGPAGWATRSAPRRGVVAVDAHRAQSAGHAVTATVWGRSYRFEGPLPASITSQGEPLLAGPVQVYVDAGYGPAGAGVEPAHGGNDVGHAVAVVLDRAGRGLYHPRHVAIGIRRFPLDRCDVHRAASGQTLRAMTLEINLPKSLARYFQTPCARQVEFPEKVPGRPFTGRFQQNNQYLFAMNDRVGLEWLAESDQYWHARDPSKHYEVHRTAAGGVMRVHFVRDPVEMPRQFTIAFGLMATPVRPRPADWRSWGNTYPYRLGHSARFRQMAVDYSYWSVAPAWLQPKPEIRPAAWQPQAAKIGALDPVHLGPFCRGADLRRNPRRGTLAPRMAAIRRRVARRRQTVRKPARGAVDGTPRLPGREFVDHFMWDVDALFRRYNVNGTVFRRLCSARVVPERSGPVSLTPIATAASARVSDPCGPRDDAAAPMPRSTSIAARKARYWYIPR